MADDDKDTPQTELEGQGEATPKDSPPQPPAEEAAPEASQDGFSPKTGESLEAYAARIRNEVSWRDRQLTQQHKRIKDRDAKAIEIEQENQRLKAQNTAKPPQEQQNQPIPTPQARPAPTGVAPDAIAAARVQIEMERTEAALLKNAEWPSALANFQRVGGIPQEFMNAVLDTDDPAYVLVALGRDMNKFTQLMELPEGKRRAQLIKIGMEPEQKAATPAKSEVKKPSEAPPPRVSLPSGGAVGTPDTEFNPGIDDRITPDEDGGLGYNAQKDKYRSNEYDDAWYAARRRQKQNSQGRPWSGKPGPRA